MFNKIKTMFTNHWKKIVIGLVVLVGGFFLWGFFSQAEDTVKTVTSSRASNLDSEKEKAYQVQIQNLKKEVEEMKKEYTTPTAEAEEPQLQKVQDLKNYRHENYGSVVKYIGKPVRKNGKTYLPLFNAPGNKGALTEPVEKLVSQVQENMTFDGIKPPKGKLSVFDVVRNPKTGDLYNILAWEVAQ